ncbi:MAG: recombinase family protein [Fuerstiella sp.]
MVRRNIVAVYLRVSTKEQNEASQREEIGRFIEKEGFDSSRIRWFLDKSTGDNLDRPAFEEMDRLIENGAIRTVITWKLDRLSRRMLDGMVTVSRWLESDVRFVSVTQDFDFRGVVGRMVAAMLFGFAELEQQTRRQRQAAGIAVARRKGVYKGRLSGTTKAQPDRAAELRERGLTDSEIATTLGVSRRTILRYKNQSVAGASR